MEMDRRTKISLISVLSGLVLLLATSGISLAEGQEETSGPGDFADMDLEALLASPVVESASRRAESLDDAPASVGLITAEEIQASGAQNIAELLRLVPGVYVRQNQANHFELGIRGISTLQNNRVLVLIDGRQMVDRLSGAHIWGGLSVDPGDIERIEVIRGPGSTFYGANAMSGVVNIVTKRPIDHPGVDADAWGSMGVLTGRKDGRRDWLQNGGGARAAINWANEAGTFGTRLSGSLTRQPEWPHNMSHSFHRGPFHYAARLVADWRPDPDMDFFASLSHSQSEFMNTLDPGTSSLWNALDQQAITLSFEKRKLGLDGLTLKAELDGRRLQEEYDAELGDAGNITQGTMESKEIHALVQLDWTTFNDRNVLSLGGEFTWFDVNKFFTEPWFIFGALLLNNELRLLEDHSLVLHLGGRFEQVTAEEDNHFGKVVYRHFSPRAAVVYKPAKDHALRLSLSSAYRTPTPYELFVSIDKQINEPPLPIHHLVIGNPLLKPEGVWALELGYRARLFDKLRLDAVLFGQQIRNLIGPVQDTIMPLSLENINDMDQLGLELGLSWAPFARLRTNLNYTFVYSRIPDSGEWDKTWPAHLWSLGAEWRLPKRCRLNLFVYLVFDHKPTLASLRNIDSGFPYFDWEQRQAADQALVNLRLGKFFFDDQAEVFFAIKNLVGFWRDEAGLRMLPHKNVQPIGGTILIGLSVRGS